MPPDRARESSERSQSEILAYVESFIDHPILVERLTEVLGAMPDAVLDDLLKDPCFGIRMDNYIAGQGSTVWMACPANIPWKGSRSVVLRMRLADSTSAFACYVIAHELAHAHLWNGGWGEITDREEAADALAASWGFVRP